MPQKSAAGQPSAQQMQQMQQQLAAEAAKNGMTVPQYVEQLKAQALRQHQQQQQRQQQQKGAAESEAQDGQQQHQHQHRHEQQVPVTPGPPKPEALAIAGFLRSQELKTRTCIFQEKRKDLFRVKRAIRALQSPAYQKARAKNPLLPEVGSDRISAEKVFKLLPLSLLALRVSKVDPNADDGHGHGHSHGKAAKRVKGLWTVRVEPQQNANDDDHYVWLYEGSQLRQKLYAIGALAVVFAVVLFPLWPLKMRIGVWYLSMGMLGMLGLFFAMSLFRLLLFCVTVFVTPPGLWLYPNLFEDVGFFDSFKPLWGWHESTDEIKAKKRVRRQAKIAKRNGKANGSITTDGKGADKAPPKSDSTSVVGGGGTIKQKTKSKSTAVPQRSEGDLSSDSQAGKELQASVEEAEED